MLFCRVLVARDLIPFTGKITKGDRTIMLSLPKIALVISEDGAVSTNAVLVSHLNTTGTLQESGFSAPPVLAKRIVVKFFF